MPKDPWEHLEVERKRILDGCKMKEPNPGASICQRCVYLNGTIKCPKHGGMPLFYYTQRERNLIEEGKLDEANSYSNSRYSFTR